MTVLNSGISWCTGTLNLSVGCTQIPVPGGSACDNCYAKTFVNRGLHGSRDFGEIRLYPERLKDLRKFAPARTAEGMTEPKLVFVNSLSDFWHEHIPDGFIHQMLDAFEGHPKVILQILTKRPVRMRKTMAERYPNGIPPHIWLGVSAESSVVAARINLLRRLKDQVGEFTAFVSVEPIFGPTAMLDFTGVDWVLTGGESGPRARSMLFSDLEHVHEDVLSRGIALHFKQYGHALNNPLVRSALWASGAEPRHVGSTASPVLSRDTARVWKSIVEAGAELAPTEKGGATYKGRVIQEKPPHYHRLMADLNRQSALI